MVKPLFRWRNQTSTKELKTEKKGKMRVTSPLGVGFKSPPVHSILEKELDPWVFTSDSFLVHQTG
jgi:hypothetical protein